MSNLVIVAIPEEQDRVWKISSEQVPHLTLLFLGDEANANTQQIMQFVEHAVTMSEHGPFYLDVERRGELGPDNADVVFFSKRSWNLKWIKQFRGQLLKNDAVKTAYDSTEQYEEWMPHLTLGYPDTPAKADPNAEPFGHPLYSVCFDRIAVWAEEYNGPEFQLEWPEREYDGDLAIAYSDSQKAALTHYAKAAGISEAEFLAHHGVKGMKWGVRGAGKAASGALSDVAAVAPYVNRRARNTALAVEAGAAAVRKIKGHQAKKTETVIVGDKTKQVTPKKAAKLDKKFEKKANTVETFLELHNGAADHVNAKLPEINATFEKKHPKEMNDGTLWNQDHPVTKAYNEAYNREFTTGLNKAAEKMGTNATGTRRVVVKTKNHESADDFSWEWKTESTGVKHATGNDEPIVFQVTRDENGRITKVEKMDEALGTAAHGETFVEGLVHGSVLDNPTLAEQIKAKIQNILDDVKGDNKDANLFGDPLIQAKIRSVLQDFYQDPNVDNAIVYDALGEVFLEHYGIPGMRWGFRKNTPTATAPQATTKVPHGARRKTQIKVEGGENHPAHEDAVRVAESKAKLKKSGPAALSNNELRDVASRVQLENQVALLTSNKGKRFVTRQLQSESQNLARAGVREGVKRGVKKAGAAAAVAA